MEQTLATNADAQVILKLYELRTEAVLREARAWITGEFWPANAEEFFAVAGNPAHPQNAWFRQVTSYWEMAAALVLHGAIPAELFMDTNGELFFILAKFAPFLDEIHAKLPSFMSKTQALIDRHPTAAARYEGLKKRCEEMRSKR